MSSLVKYGLLSFPIASCGLGYWQLKRLEWKNNLITNLGDQLSEEPVDLLSLDLPQALDKFEYRRVKVRGRYDPNPRNQLYLKPRPLIVNDEAIYRGRTAHQSNIGVNVITPFQIDGTDLRILVNRGWLSIKGRESVEDSSHIGLNKADTSIDLVGIVRKTDRRPRYGLKNDVTKNEWQIRDIEAMSKVLKTAPIFIDAIEDTTRREGPYGGQTALQIRNEHLNYAITWFALAAFTLALWYGKYGRRRVMKSKLAD